MLNIFSFAYWPTDRILCLLTLLIFNLLNFPLLWLLFDIMSNNNLHLTKKRSRTFNVRFCHELLIDYSASPMGRKTLSIILVQLLFPFEDKSTLFFYNENNVRDHDSLALLFSQNSI